MNNCILYVELRILMLSNTIISKSILILIHFFIFSFFHFFIFSFFIYHLSFFIFLFCTNTLVDSFASEFHEFSKQLAAQIIGFLPCLTKLAYKKIFTLSRVNDDIFSVINRRHFLFSWTTVQQRIKEIVGDREKDMSITLYQPKGKKGTSQPIEGSSISFVRSILHTITSDVSSKEVR
jgi:hypothetical protein